MQKQESNGTGPSIPLAKKVVMVAIGLLLIAGGVELYRSYDYQQQQLMSAQYDMEVAQNEAQNAIQEADKVKQQLGSAQQAAETAKQEAEAAKQEAEKAKQEREAALKEAADAQKAAADAEKALQSAPSKQVASEAETFLEGSTKVNYKARVVSPDGVGVNLREGPGSTYDKVREKPVPVKTELTISAEKTAQNGTLWGYTEYDGSSGWVYLAELEPI